MKGTAFQYIADRFGAERIYYFDPDILVLGRLDDLERNLDRHSILLTPHHAVRRPTCRRFSTTSSAA